MSDLQGSPSFEHYSISDQAMDYRILHMDEDQDRMYVGCKDHVLSMDINNVTDGTLKVGRAPQSVIPQIAVISYPDAILAFTAASQLFFFFPSDHQSHANQSSFADAAHVSSGLIQLKCLAAP